MDPTFVGLISAATAVGGGAVTKAFDSWLGGRSKVIEELREDRLRSYTLVWERTATLSAWPRTDATYGDLKSLHIYLRSWYFSVGGLYLSENARVRYGEMQGLIAAHLRHHSDALDEQLKTAAYDDLKDACSAFRTAITGDLESRRQRSLFWTIGRWRLHQKQRRAAQARLKRVGARGKQQIRAEIVRPESESAELPAPAQAQPARDSDDSD